MTNISSKRLIQITLLCMLLGSGFSLADTSSRLEPIGAPVPVETITEAEDQAGSDTEARGSEQEKDSFEQAISEELQTVFADPGTERFHWELLIPILAITFIFGGPLALIIVLAVLHYRSKTRRAQIKAELTLKALETGRELPPELLQQNSVETPEGNLRKGIKNIGLGVGIVAGLSFLVGFDIGALGFILVGVGSAQLLLWKLDKPKQNESA